MTASNRNRQIASLTLLESGEMEFRGIDDILALFPHHGDTVSKLDLLSHHWLNPELQALLDRIAKADLGE